MPPEVSIIIPCYNQGSYLAQAIRSVLAQTYKNWELIVVDDGSTDDTARLSKGFDDPRILYFHQENRGLSASRNVGIRSTSAPVIALLDSDDLWEPPYLERMLQCLNRNPDAAAAYSGYAYIDAAGNRIGAPCRKVVDPGQFRRKLLFEGNWLVPSAVVLRRQQAEEEGLFDESLKAVEDLDLWRRLSERHAFIGIGDVLVLYRVHEASMSRDPEFMVANFQRMTTKICGPPDGDFRSWGRFKKEVHTRSYQYAAVRYGSAGNTRMCAHYYLKFYELSASRALGMPVWRSFARLHLPLQFKGRPFLREDWAKAIDSHARLLDEISRRASESGMPPRDLRRIRSRACLAIAEEGVYAGSRVIPCKWLVRALVASPGILLSRPFWGTLARLFGLRTVDS